MRFSFHSLSDGGDKRDRTADLLNAIQALSRAKRVRTPLNTGHGECIQYAKPPKTSQALATWVVPR